MRGAATRHPKVAVLGALVLATALGAQAPSQDTPEAVAEKGPGEVPTQETLARGGKALEAGDLEAAEELFEAALAEAPDDISRAMAELGLTRTFELRGDSVTALTHARRAQQAAPSDAAVAFIVGRLLATVGAASEAVAALERAAELAPLNPNPPLLAAFVLRDDGRIEEAVELLEKAWSRGLDAPAVAEQIGALSLTLDRPARTIEISREMLAVDADQAEFQMLLGLALAKDPDARQGAIGALRTTLRLGAPNIGLASLELGILLLAEGDHEAALAALREAEVAMPEIPEVFYRQAAALRMAGDRDGARAAIERFQKLRTAIDQAGSESKRLGTELNRAFSLIDDNRLDDALAVLDDILVSAPDNPRVHASRAKVLHSMGRTEEALAAAIRARELDPSRSEHHFLEGLFLARLGRPAEAEIAERQALALDPNLAQAHLLLAGALAKQGKAEEAVRHFERALELGEDSPPLRLGYAAALETLGRDAESEEQMAAYRRLRASEVPPP